MLLPHVLSRVPLGQLLLLQRVSRAFRALVQLHLAGLRRFDAAQVSGGWGGGERGTELRPHLGTALAWSPAQFPVPLSPLSGPLTPPSRGALEGIHLREVLSKGAYRVSASEGAWGMGSLLGGQVASPRGQAAARRELIWGE